MRARTTKDLAQQIRALPVVPNKLRLAGWLASLSTEGDLGRETLQSVTTTLALALQEQRPAGKSGEPDDLYIELASLVRYEHMQAESDNPQFAQAMAKMEAADAAPEKADFTLSDLQGKMWHLRDLRGKVVLVNFWATWCRRAERKCPISKLSTISTKTRGSWCWRFLMKKRRRSAHSLRSGKSAIPCC